MTKNGFAGTVDILQQLALELFGLHFSGYHIKDKYPAFIGGKVAYVFVYTGTHMQESRHIVYADDLGLEPQIEAIMVCESTQVLYGVGDHYTRIPVLGINPALCRKPTVMGERQIAEAGLSTYLDVLTVRRFTYAVISLLGREQGQKIILHKPQFGSATMQVVFDNTIDKLGATVTKKLNRPGAILGQVTLGFPHTFKWHHSNYFN